MKILQIIFALIIPVISFSQTFELSGKDTVNITDAAGIKKGRWIYFDTEKKTKLSEGPYKNSLKNGIWTDYYPSGAKKSEITFNNNRKKGYAKIYFENGNLKEEGNWDENKWTGEYKFYYENGNPFYIWNFDKDGQRTGHQQYFHENGKPEIEGNWNAGKETGIIKEYNEDGLLIAEKSFNDGVFDATASKEYSPANKQTENHDSKKEETKTIINENKNSNVEVFSGEGYHKFYNAAGMIDKEGEFQKGFLISGKRYFYDASGKLIKTEVYENGKISQVIIQKQ
jgi:antitoxin component YwqK of YwqJK toxin-antitoxin module